MYCLRSYPNAAEVMQVVSANQPHEMTALYHLLLRRLEAHCAARGTSLEDFERRFSAALELSTRPPPTQAPPAATAAAATAATLAALATETPHTPSPILPPPGGPLAKTQRGESSTPHAESDERKTPHPQPPGARLPDERRVTPSKARPHDAPVWPSAQVFTEDRYRAVLYALYSRMPIEEPSLQSGSCHQITDNWTVACAAAAASDSHSHSHLHLHSERSSRPRRSGNANQ